MKEVEDSEAALRTDSIELPKDDDELLPIEADEKEGEIEKPKDDQ